jgi:hypothetical protein
MKAAKTLENRDYCVIPGGMSITKSLSLVSEGVGLFAFLAALALRRRLDQFRITA